MMKHSNTVVTPSTPGLLRSTEGYIMLRRKSLWVNRYAKVDKQFFSYKKDKSKTFQGYQIDDTKARAFIDLRVADISVVTGNNNAEKVIKLSQRDGIDLYLAFKTSAEFDKWH